jgi:L-malate glycosyltransferase
MRIHQLSPSISEGDATSNQLFEIDARLKAWGHESILWAQNIQPSLAGRVRPLEEIRPFLQNPNDLLIYHYGIFHFCTHIFQSARCRKMLIYHNITPAHFYSGWEPNNEQNCRVGRLVLNQLTDCDLAVGVSEFNRQELILAGFDANKTAVLPIFLTPGQKDALPTDTRLQAQIRKRSSTNWLTVGRIVPNKAIDEVLRLFFVYLTQINPDAHLYLVGSRRLENYNQALTELVDILQISKHVTFTDRISDSHLKTYYETADLYVTTSYHEGFCVPLLESMHFRLPILARKAAAMPETLGHTGVLFTHLGYAETAEMAHLMTTEAQIRQQIINAQTERLTAFGVPQLEKQLREILAQIGVT